MSTQPWMREGGVSGHPCVRSPLPPPAPPANGPACKGPDLRAHTHPTPPPRARAPEPAGPSTRQAFLLLCTGWFSAIPAHSLPIPVGPDAAGPSPWGRGRCPDRALPLG